MLECFKRWLDEQADVVLPKSPIGEAVHYARAQWTALTRYLIVATCKEHAIDVWAYLKDVLERIPTHPDRRRAELLPRNWKAARAEPKA
jgi:transposase